MQDESRLVVEAQPRSQRFVPTCDICGNKHWPKDPSCSGKKGAKGKGKAKAKVSARAKKRAKKLEKAESASKDIEQKVTTPGPVILPKPITKPAKPDFRFNAGTQTPSDEVIKIKAQSKEEVSSFDEEVERIRQQADQVVAKAAESAAEQFQAEREARIAAEAEVKKQTEARELAEQKLKDEIENLKALQIQLQNDIHLAKEQSLNAVQESQVQQESDSDVDPSIQADENIDEKADLEKDDSRKAAKVGRLLAVRARDIMEENIVWASPDDSIAKVLDQMLEQGSYYALVCQDERVAGIVSRLDISGRASSYLHPHIAKWQKDGADETFNLAVKWIMSKRVEYIYEEATCTAIMKKMRYLNMSPLPVVDKKGKVAGLVAPYNVFKIRALLKLEAQQKTSGKSKLETLPKRIASYMSSLKLKSPDKSPAR